MNTPEETQHVWKEHPQKSPFEEGRLSEYRSITQSRSKKGTVLVSPRAGTVPFLAVSTQTHGLQPNRAKQGQTRLARGLTRLRQSRFCSSHRPSKKGTVLVSPRLSRRSPAKAEAGTVPFLAVSTLGLLVVVLAGCATTASGPYVSSAPAPDGNIVVQVASASDTDPFAAGKTAAEALLEQMDGAPLQAVILAECFEEEALKQQALKGVASVLPADLLFGISTYGSFAQEGCLDLDAVTLVGIGGDGIGVTAALAPLDIVGLTMEDNLDVLQERLRSAGSALMQDAPRTPDDKLVILLSDAHSPKNQFLVEGAQSVVGPKFPITGGSANKNAGQSFVYYRGQMYTDAAATLVLSGNFQVSLAGRQAKSNDAVIASATEASAEAKAGLPVEPIAALAFNCAGRKGKLDDIEDELAAIQETVGPDLPLFGCYCAGEIGPADASPTGALSSGVGWHLMFTVIGR